MPWRLLLLADGSVRNRPFLCGYAAFLNESTSREIITGRYTTLPEAEDETNWTASFPKDSAASSTKWEVNMKRKYRAASSAIVFKITEVLSPVFLDRVTKKMVNEKAKKSAVSTFSAGRARCPYT